MKQEFWKHEGELLYFWPFCTLLSTSCLIVGIIMTIKASFYWPIIAFGVLTLFICIYAVFFEKRTLCKVIFSEEEITVKRFNKIVTTMKWSEIINVEGIYIGNKGGRYMKFVSKNNHIDVVPTQKMYNAIIEICPYQDIKNQINNIECFKWYHRHK